MNGHLPAFGSTTLLLIALTGCSGDERPFEEAVEIRELGLQRLVVEAPANSLAALSVGVGGSIDFDVVGFGNSVTPVELDDSDRDWRVDDASVASISRNGVVTGLSDGTVAVTVTIGGLVSGPQQLTVSSAALSSLSIDGPVDADPCLAARYSAIGTFVDGTSRPLTNVVWTLPQGSNASLRDGRLTIDGAGIDETASTGSILLIATPPAAGGSSTIALNATSDGTSLARDVTVGDTLRSLSLPDGTRSLRIDATLDLTARGTYTRGDTTTELDVTDTVDWSVLDGSRNVRVSNAAPDRGRVTGRETGNATVQAACGNVTDSVIIGVNSSSVGDDSGSGLVFEGGNTRSIAPGTIARLRVSTGSDYDADRDVTADAGTTFESDATSVVSVVRSGTDAGLITASNSIGQSARISATRNGVTVTTTVTIR